MDTKFYDDKSDKFINKEIALLTKKIEHYIKMCEGEMSWNGNRSTRKATASHAVWSYTQLRDELEKYMNLRSLSVQK